MTFGLSVHSKGWGLTPINISSGWHPAIYVGRIDITIQYRGGNSAEKTFTHIPQNTRLFVLAGSSISHAYFQPDPFGGYGVTSNFNVEVSGHKVRVWQGLWAYFANAGIVGKKVTFYVFGFITNAPNQDDYGILFQDSGVPTIMSANIRPNVALWKKTHHAGTSSKLTYDTGISVTAYPDAPTPFISDTGNNALQCWCEKYNNQWRVVVNRGRMGRTYQSRYTTPNSGTVRVVLFGKYNGRQEAYGLTLFGSNGQPVYSSVAPPLMLRRALNLPKLTQSNHNVFDVRGDQFSANELAHHPMVNAMPMGLIRLSFVHFTSGLCITSNGRFTSGTCSREFEYRGGAPSQVWNTGYNGSVGCWIYGTDYFDDY